MTLTSVAGVEVGHWTDRAAVTGVTVITFPEPNRAVVELRGAAPGSRETALLRPEMRVETIQALVFVGGSAFGLAAADGVVRELEEDGRGHPTPLARVPIVPAAVIYDLGIGDPSARPGPAAGADAYRNRSEDVVAQGNVGAGMGAMIANWRGPEAVRKGGLGSSAVRAGDVTVGALAVVNAVGDVFDLDGVALSHGPTRPSWELAKPPGTSNTTLICVATDGALGTTDLLRVAVRAQDAVAACVRPGHSRYDGDAAFAVSCGSREANPDAVGEAAFVAVGEAIAAGVLAAESVAGVPSVTEG